MNNLFPVFLKLEELQLLIVGAGAVGLEKVTAILSNSPTTKVSIVAPDIREEIRQLAIQYPSLQIIQREYLSSDLEGKDLVIAATCIKELNGQVQKDAKSRKVLINVADTPELCDFYLGSIVRKGDLKIAISTNGKSPTFAKRMREVLEDVLPEGIDAILENLNQIRNRLKGDFDYKVKKMNEITSSFKESKKE